MAAVVPVCAGISLEYYFSFVDNDRYGCGTKLPHNVTGLVGVMDGHASDLRTGLPWQMVEIHEPVRILFVVETTPDRLSKVIDASPSLNQLVGNRWIALPPLIPHRDACTSEETAALKSSTSVWSACQVHSLPPNGLRAKPSIFPWPGFRHGLKPLQETAASEPFPSLTGFGGVGAGCDLRSIIVIVAARAGFRANA